MIWTLVILAVLFIAFQGLNRHNVKKLRQRKNRDFKTNYLSKKRKTRKP